MTTREKWMERVRKLRVQASDFFNEADGIADTDEARADELITQGEKALADSHKWEARADAAEKLDNDLLAQTRNERDGPPEKTNRDGSVHADVLNREVTPEDLRSRMEVAERLMSGEQVTEREANIVGRRLPHERIWQRWLFRNHPDPDLRTQLTPDELRAYKQGMEAEVRQFTPFMGTNQANAGAHTVPTLIANRIVATMAYAGPMGSLTSGAMTTLLAPGQKIDVVQVTDSHTKVAVAQAEGADGVLQQVTTNKITLTPEKRSFPMAFTEEILRANAVNFESRVVGMVSSFFAREMNEDLTGGDGSGVSSFGLTTTTNSIDGAAKAPTEAKVYDLYAALDPMYEMDPTAQFQAHKLVISGLMRLKGAGDYRAFPLSADRKLPIMPGGLPLYVNQNLAGAAPSAGNTLLFLGALNRYELAHTPFRAATQYEVLDDKYVLGFFMSWDGAIADARAFHKLVSN